MTKKEAITLLRRATYTPESIAESLGDDAEVVEGCLVLAPRAWVCADDGYTSVVHADSGDEAAADYVAGGDGGGGASTAWIRVRVHRVGLTADGDEVRVDEATHTIAIDPDEPDCITHDGGHDWQAPVEIVGGLAANPGVSGRGGGVSIKEVCVRCGTRRETDKWAQDPATGEQGLTSVSYARHDDFRRRLSIPA